MVNRNVQSTARPVSAARIVGLVIIGVLALGLLYLRFGSGDSEVSVPDGAQAGDLILEPCTYSTEDGKLAADCGTVVVPKNRRNPDSRLIALPVTRIRATGDAAEPIFRLEGGPGITNMKFSRASRLTEHHDVVLVGYRGVEGSSVLDCPEVESALKGTADFVGEESLRRYTEAFADCSQRLSNDGVDLDGYSLPQRVDDLEAARTALGYERINLVSESVGTRTAMIYAWRYPGSIHRSAMIGVNPPGHFLWDPETTDDQLGHYSELCAQDEKCGGKTEGLDGSMRETAEDMPDRWWLLPIKEGNVKVASHYGLFETNEEVAPLNAPSTIDAWLSADGGSPGGFWFLSLLADLSFPEAWVWGEFASIAMMDAEAANAFYTAGGDPGSILGNDATDFLWGGGGLTEVWPVSPDYDEYREVQASNVETLLIGGTVDFSTPTRFATDELLPSLPNGKQVILSDFGHSADFWEYQPEASTRLLTAFFDRGEIDDSLYTEQAVKFDVGVPTFLNIALILLGMMAGFGLIAIAVLAWMGRVVIGGRTFGFKTSVALRMLTPFLLGLGGWFLALLIMMIVWPSFFVGSQLLAALSMGIAIGLGVYLAWVSRETRFLGLAAAVAGALIGAWLGFDAAAGFAGILTTIVGAATTANLALIVLDIVWDRSGYRKSPAA